MVLGEDMNAIVRAGEEQQDAEQSQTKVDPLPRHLQCQRGASPRECVITAPLPRRDALTKAWNGSNGEEETNEIVAATLWANSWVTRDVSVSAHREASCFNTSQAFCFTFPSDCRWWELKGVDGSASSLFWLSLSLSTICMQLRIAIGPVTKLGSDPSWKDRPRYAFGAHCSDCNNEKIVRLL